MNMNSSSSSSSSSLPSSVAKGKKRYRGQHHIQEDQQRGSSSTKRRISENAAGASSSSEGRVMTRGMMRQMMEHEGLGSHQNDLIHEVKMIQELPEEMKDVNDDDDNDDDVVVGAADDGTGCKIEKSPALVEWDDDLGWYTSWVFEEKLGLCGSWDWDWIWYPYWDMMIDNWALDGDDEIVWEDDIWSLQDSNKNQTTPKN